MIALHEKIAARRTRIGLSIDEVATLAGLSVERIEGVERGDAPTAWEFAALAGALALDPARLLRDEADDPRWSVARFRSQAGVEGLDALDARTLARAAEAGRILQFLRDACGLPRARVSALREVTAVSATSEPWQHGYELGKHARERLSPTEAPLVSLQALLEGAGALVLDLPLRSTTVEAASLVEPDASPVIVLNSSVRRVRTPLSRRAILAHELCHLLHDATGERDLATVLSRRGDESPVEQRANGFAPSFLAPRLWVKKSRGNVERQLVTLAETWGLSFEGAVWHAKNLEFISPKTASQIIARHPRPKIDARGFEPEIFRDAIPNLEVEVSEFGRSALGDQAMRAMSREVISEGRAAEILAFR